MRKAKSVLVYSAVRETISKTNFVDFDVHVVMSKHVLLKDF